MSEKMTGGGEALRRMDRAGIRPEEQQEVLPIVEELIEHARRVDEAMRDLDEPIPFFIDTAFSTGTESQ